jgi:hypothetical protein
MTDEIISKGFYIIKQKKVETEVAFRKDEMNL